MDKVLLITGASSGVGLSLARYLSGRFHIIAVARRLERITREFAGNSSVDAYRMDLSDPKEVTSVMEHILSRHGYIPFLINNAGTNLKAAIPELSAPQLVHSLQVNAVSPLMILGMLMPQMRARNFGRVIHVTSGAPLNCFPGYGAYSASKGALNALTVTAAKECADCNIKINLMSPGPVRSEMAPDAPMDPSVCHPTADYLLGLDKDGPTGRFFWLGYEIPLFPDLEGVRWLEGKADDRFRKVL